MTRSGRFPTWTRPRRRASGGTSRTARACPGACHREAWRRTQAAFAGHPGGGHPTPTQSYVDAENPPCARHALTPPACRFASSPPPCRKAFQKPKDPPLGRLVLPWHLALVLPFAVAFPLMGLWICVLRLSTEGA